MKQGTLVCLTGLDGAGKSTLTSRVVAKLRRDGYEVTHAYGRYLPRIAYPVMEAGRMTVFAESDIEADYDDHQSEKENFFSSDALSSLYEGLLMADYAPQFLIRVVIPLYYSDVVVCDRYFYDTLLTDMAGDVFSGPEQVVDRYDRYQRFLPTPDHEFYVEVPPEVSMKRKDDIPSESYLEDRKDFYDTFADEFRLTTLDGTNSLESLEKQILDTITRSASQRT